MQKKKPSPWSIATLGPEERPVGQTREAIFLTVYPATHPPTWIWIFLKQTYVSQFKSDFTDFWNATLYLPPQNFRHLGFRQPSWIFMKKSILARTIVKFQRKDQQLISSVALLSPACSFFFLSFGPGVLACATIFFYAFCFSSTLGKLPCVKICFPQSFGITRGNIFQKIFFLGNFYFLVGGPDSTIDLVCLFVCSIKF